MRANNCKNTVLFTNMQVKMQVNPPACETGGFRHILFGFAKLFHSLIETSRCKT
nr:MAG TPA: hypothetical protein [Caudoviricetes sp.]